MPKSLELLSRSIKFYRDNFKAILEILAVPLVLWALLLMFGIAGSTASFMTGYGFFATVIVLIVIIVAVIANVWQQVALYYFLNTNDKSLRAMDYYKASKDRLLPYFITSFLAALVTFAGFLLLIVPGIIFFIRYSMANIISVTENIEATAALRKSKEYVEGHWGQVAGRFLVLIVAAMFIFISLAFFMAFLFGEDSFAGGLIFNLLIFLIAPVFSVYVFEIYKYLKEVKTATPSADMPVLKSDAKYSPTPPVKRASQGLLRTLLIISGLIVGGYILFQIFILLALIPLGGSPGDPVLNTISKGSIGLFAGLLLASPLLLLGIAGLILNRKKSVKDRVVPLVIVLVGAVFAIYVFSKILL